jgi:hypothetical protein
MRYGSAMVEKLIDGRKHVIKVRVAVERPSSPSGSYIRYGTGITENGVSIGAWSGARYARHKVDHDSFGVEIHEITGDLDTMDACDGAAVACVAATWIAYGVDWKDADLGPTYGWSLRQPSVAHPSFDSDWSPTTLPVATPDFEECTVLVLHYWAIWNLIDREMDKRLATLREEYADRVFFRSCDTDRAENQPFIHGVGNLPALGCFIAGKWFKTLVGLRTDQELRSALDSWLTAAVAPANQSPPPHSAGNSSFLRKLLRRSS